ncbi:MAG: hypothetical protein J0H12_06340 [Candidatus Paracaedimonas acanthamoebae]|uniref:Uncharacterized protein n=1 Tax=Candidatus Paracaedimonas acanthamoebae TaxID=244581 RepID=A0A8J7Q1C2_9PROT|nr:hypothetical protein [Candidatus Paracaedimonas acanthamoebae]
MIIKIEGKVSASDLHKVVDILSIYFQKHGVEEFIKVDIDLKPFSKEIQLPVTFSSEKGGEIESLVIKKSKGGDLEIIEAPSNNSWMTSPFGSISPGELMKSIWPLYLLLFFLFISYFLWIKA